MTKTKNTKRALLASILSMLLCCAMFIGSTFAWFTDSVTSGKNKIVAGILDIELEYCLDPSAENADWKSVQGAEDLFDIALWEPGTTGVVYFRLSNRGTLALKYQLGMNFTDTVIGESVTDKEIKLSEVLKFGIAAGQDEAFKTREDAIDAVKESEKWLNEGYTDGQSMPVTEDKTYFALVVYMPETVGNDANYKTGTTPPSIELGVKLVATQFNSESDSFGPDYDENATYPTKTITNASALKAESSKTSNASINLKLANDITASEPVIAVADDSVVNVDFGGNELTITADGITAVQSAPGATLTLSNGTVVCPYDSTAAVQLFSAEEESDAPVPFISANGGTVILEDMTIQTPNASYVVSTGVGGNLIIKNSTINSTSMDKGAVLVESGATATIDAGTEAIAGILQVNDEGTLIIMSGLFTAEPFDYLYSDENGYGESTDEPNADGFYEVTRWDVADTDDPFGEE